MEITANNILLCMTGHGTNVILCISTYFNVGLNGLTHQDGHGVERRTVNRGGGGSFPPGKPPET